MPFDLRKACEHIMDHQFMEKGRYETTDLQLVIFQLENKSELGFGIG